MNIYYIHKRLERISLFLYCAFAVVTRAIIVSLSIRIYI